MLFEDKAHYFLFLRVGEKRGAADEIVASPLSLGVVFLMLDDVIDCNMRGRRAVLFHDVLQDFLRRRLRQVHSPDSTAGERIEACVRAIGIAFPLHRRWIKALARMI